MVCLWTHPTTLITWGSSCLTQHNNGVVQWCVPLPKRNHFNMVSSVFRWLLALCTCNDLKAEVWNLNQEILTFDVDWNVATVLVRVAVNHLHTVSLLSPNWSPRSETLCPVPVRWLGGDFPIDLRLPDLTVPHQSLYKRDLDDGFIQRYQIFSLMVKIAYVCRIETSLDCCIAS